MQKPEKLNLKTVQSWLLPRPKDTHKYSLGHIYVVGGDFGMPGSVRIAAEGALRVGAGLVSVITHNAHMPTTICGRPELLCYGIELDNFERLDSLLSNATMIVIGPGLGQSEWSYRLFHKVLQTSVPLLIDADGLNLLAKIKLTPRENWILTPHPGEASRLLGVDTQEIQANRIKSIHLLHQKYGGVIVLKGAGTLVMANKQDFKICLAGNPGMASAGMGDLLSGIIAGLFAQGLTLSQAAQAGVLFHAMAGDRVADKRGQRGLLATDLLSEIFTFIL